MKSLGVRLERIGQTFIIYNHYYNIIINTVAITRSSGFPPIPLYSILLARLMAPVVWSRAKVVNVALWSPVTKCFVLNTSKSVVVCGVCRRVALCHGFGGDHRTARRQLDVGVYTKKREKKNKIRKSRSVVCHLCMMGVASSRSHLFRVVSSAQSKSKHE
jgi:hypothetical protein